ncbi:MAG TPA: class III lanthionine synthetase LanKC [Polyangiaceae bacterium]|nr:class III lanthionine synthetase LanKC [Polyangiaceae bacterium]
MEDIERRVRDGLYMFTFIHPERYRGVDTYRSHAADFRDLVKRLLPDKWTIREAPGVWCQVRAPQDRTPDSGFKIHLSATHDRARETLETVVPILVEEGVAFKFLVDAQILDLSNSHLWHRSMCGKFITIYPTDEDQLKRLLERLHEVTKGLKGPYILSDRRYKDSKVLFYRYGVFRGAEQITAYGEMMGFYRTTDGRLLPDVRMPYFVLPEGIHDPFPDTEEEAAEVILKGRYKAVSSLGSSSKGGVYECIDLETDAKVVVKEGRPLVNRGRWNPYDVVDTLKNEHRVLKVLEGTHLVPSPVDFFQEWEHSFLVMEMAKGVPLNRYCASGAFSIILTTTPSAEEVRVFCRKFIAMSRKLIDGLRAIHAKGVVIQDISPRNILFDAERDELTFIDFEAAYTEQGDVPSPILGIRTPGFGAHARHGEKPTVSEDYAALSSLLGDFLYPPTTFFSIAPDHRRPMLSRVAKEKAVPEAFLRLIFGVAEHPERADDLLAEAERSIEGITAPQPIAPARSDGDLRSIVSGIASYIVDETQSSDDPLDLPVDYRRYYTNQLSVSFGASGVALFLKRAGGEVPGAFLDALVREAAAITNDTYAPGLYVGSSGVAWTLLELGMREQAEALMATAAKSPVLSENADIFYGAAGWGLANLFFFRKLGDERYLKSAVEAFAAIKPKLEREDKGIFYVNDGLIYSGLAHGPSGIGYFMLRLYEATRQEEHLDVARGLFDFDLSKAEEKDGEILFRRAVNDTLFYPYWRIGSAGVGAVAVRFHAALGDAKYMNVARAIARTLAGAYSVFPTNFFGMTGFGSFFLDMHQHTGEEGYLEEARRFVDRVMLFAIEKPTGIVFPGEELLRISTDYGTGSAGTGLFIHRLLAGGGVPYFDL